MQRSLVILEIALYWGIILSLVIDLRDINLHLGMIMSERILLRHVTLIDLFHIGTCSFFRWGRILSLYHHDDFEEWRFILIRWCMIGCTPLIDVLLHWGIAHPSTMDFVRWRFMPNTCYSDIILHWGLTHFERMHSYWGIATLLILTLRLHLLFMIASFDGS